MAETLTRDAFLGGRLTLAQPARGYRAGVDPVLLAASVPALPGQSVLELGCGVGTALFCLGKRVPGLALTGLEIQESYAALARQNAAENGIAAEIIHGDLAQMPVAVRGQQFDHVIANPPYFDRNTSTPAQDAGREHAIGEHTPLATWVKTAAKRCAPRGYVSMIHRAERLPELLALISARLGSVQVLPLIPRQGRPARLVLIRGRQGGRSNFKLFDGIVMHEGDDHSHDAENYSAAITYALRDGGELVFPA